MKSRPATHGLISAEGSRGSAFDIPCPVARMIPYRGGASGWVRVKGT